MLKRSLFVVGNCFSQASHVAYGHLVDYELHWSIWPCGQSYSLVWQFHRCVYWSWWLQWVKRYTVVMFVLSTWSITLSNFVLVQFAGKPLEKSWTQNERTSRLSLSQCPPLRSQCPPNLRYQMHPPPPPQKSLSLGPPQSKHRMGMKQQSCWPS